VITVEALAGISLLVILIGVGLNSFESAIAKARLSEILLFLSTERLALQEQLALTGEGLPPHLGEPRSAEKKAGEKQLEYSVTQIESSLIAEGTMGDARTPFFLAYTPAVIAKGVPGSMMWLCGNRQPPAGWARLPGPGGTDLPAKYLYSVCRDNKES
jgi:type II secretory pathway pseudopilin PulG